MPRGYCPVCEDLVEIETRNEPIKPGFSACRWYPRPHLFPGTKSACPGTNKAL